MVGKKERTRVSLASFDHHYLPTVACSCSVPYLLVSFTADPQHFFTLQLQLSGQSVNGLIQRVDLVVQVSDAVVTGAHLSLEIWDPSQEFLFLPTRKARRPSGQQEDAFRRRKHKVPLIRYLLVAVLHGALQLTLGSRVLFKVDLLEMFDRGSVKVVEFCAERRCNRESEQSSSWWKQAAWWNEFWATGIFILGTPLSIDIIGEWLTGWRWNQGHRFSCFRLK